MFAVTNDGLLQVLRPNGEAIAGPTSIPDLDLACPIVLGPDASYGISVHTDAAQGINPALTTVTLEALDDNLKSLWRAELYKGSEIPAGGFCGNQEWPLAITQDGNTLTYNLFPLTGLVDTKTHRNSTLTDATPVAIGRFIAVIHGFCADCTNTLTSVKLLDTSGAEVATLPKGGSDDLNAANMILRFIQNGGGKNVTMVSDSSFLALHAVAGGPHDDLVLTDLLKGKVTKIAQVKDYDNPISFREVLADPQSGTVFVGPGEVYDYRQPLKLWEKSVTGCAANSGQLLVGANKQLG